VNSDEVPTPEGYPDWDHWIIVRNWDRFQHYKNRNPRWIKVYAQLLHDPAFIRLSPAAKGLLLVVWLAYSQTNGVLSIRDLHDMRVAAIRYPQLMSLNYAGFIDFSASKPLATKKETERETEKESPSPLTDQDAQRLLMTDAEAEHLLRQRAFEFADDWNGGPSSVFDEHLDMLERELHAQLRNSERYVLWDHARKHDHGG